MNWGHGITIFIVAFMAFILSMVYRATQRDVDLVAENYYEQEIAYESTISALKNGNESSVNIKQENNMLIIEFNEDTKDVENGSISLYRPDNAKLDLTIDLKLINNEHKIPLEILAKGNYKLKLKWTDNNTNKLIEQDIVIP